ncbi:MAG: LytR/AlgR family response regulator transcription factor [Saprospiraceae bacterium]
MSPAIQTGQVVLQDMKILIIEDEFHAARRLEKLVRELQPNAEILGNIDSVEDAVDWFGKHPQPDLLFMDIQLADGLSFDIFKRTQVTAPVIFTTAFDEYALKAFKTNSVDYLLKPIDQEELERALDKFNALYRADYDTTKIDNLLQSLHKKDYAERFLIKSGEQFLTIPVADIAYVFSESSLTFIRTQNNKKYLLDYTLDEVQQRLNPTNFYRINRKMVVRVAAIGKIHTYFNSRLKLELIPKMNDEVVVSRERVKAFKAWLGE